MKYYVVHQLNSSLFRRDLVYTYGIFDKKNLLPNKHNKSLNQIKIQELEMLRDS